MYLFNRLKSNSFFPLWVTISFICLALVKIWLVSGQTLFAVGNGMHDDRLFINLAQAFLSGQWLGTYDKFTLIKGPFYSIWIAIVSILGIPLLLAQHVLYIAACLTFIIAVRPLMPRPVLLLVAFTLLLFNPMSYTDEVMTRVLREGIYPALTILVLACAIGLSVRYEATPKSIAFWSIGLGFALSGFWLTREEGIWIIPSLAIVIFLGAFNIWKKEFINRKQTILIFILPFFIWILALGSVAFMNKFNYGLFTTVEFKSNDFLSAYGALARIRQTNQRLFVPVPKETREQVYPISPAFAEVQPFLEGDIGKGWTQASCFEVSVCNDIAAGFFMWALRDAVAAAGHYTSARSAATYYRRMAVEINNACESGKLACEKERASMMPPWHNEYMKLLLNKIIRAFIFVIRFDTFNPSSGFSEGNEDSLLLFREITHEQLSPSNVLQLHGWIIIPSHNVDLSIRTPMGNPMAASVEYDSNGSDQKSYIPGDRNKGDVKRKYFEITTNCTKGCYLYMNKGANLVAKIPLDGSIMSLENPEIRFRLDFWGQKKIYLSPPNQSKMNKLNINILTRLGKEYHNIMPFLIGMAVIAYIINTINCFRRRNISALWVISTSLIVAIFARVFLLSLIEVTSFPAINTSYLSPVYPLLSILPALIFADLLLSIRRREITPISARRAVE